MAFPPGITLEKKRPKILTLGEEFLYQASKNDSIFPPSSNWPLSSVSKYNSSCFFEFNYAQLQQNSILSFVMHSNFLISTLDVFTLGYLQVD